MEKSLSMRRVWIEIVCVTFYCYDISASLSMRRVWIEIVCVAFYRYDISASLSMRRVWIEIVHNAVNKGRGKSLSMRRVWIEIELSLHYNVRIEVTLHAESVD